MKKFVVAMSFIFSILQIFSSASFALTPRELLAIENKIQAISKTIQQFGAGNYDSFREAARSHGKLPEIYLKNIRTNVAQQLQEVRAQLVAQQALAKTQQATEIADLAAQYDLVIGQALIRNLLKSDTLESRFFRILTPELGDSLLIPQTPEVMVAIRKQVSLYRALNRADASGITNLYSALAWREAFAANITITKPMQRTLSEFSSLAQVMFFQEVLKQKYSLRDARMQKILTISEGNENPALMLAMLGANDVKIIRDDIYQKLFQIYDESQIEYANHQIARSKEGDVDASSSILVEAAKGANQKLCNVLLGG